MKKFLVLLLAISLITTVFAGYGIAKSKYKDTKELEFMAWWPVAGSNDAVVQAIEKKFNVKIKLTLADWQPNIDNIAIRVASGNYPDYMLIPYYWVNTLGTQYTSMMEDGLLVNISDAVQKYHFKNLQAQLDMATNTNPKMKAIYADKKGDYYCLPRHDGYPNPGMFIRKDWLEKTGMKPPKTLDELYAVLKAFVAKDPDGTKNIGLVADGIGPLEQIITEYTGVNQSGWTKKDGKWTNKIMLPEYKNALKVLNKLYKEGLLDPEFAITNTVNAREKFATGKGGVIIHNANGVDYRDFLQTPLKKYKAGADVIVLPEFPKGPSGKRNSGSPYGSCGVLFKSKDAEKNARVLAILDWLLSKEGTDLMLNGIKGVHYQLKNGKHAYGKGQWATSLKYHCGKYFACFVCHDM